MTVASKEAYLLHGMLASRASEHDPLEGLGRAFLAEATPLIETPWMMAAIPDFVFPETRGERPVDLEERLRFAGALVACCGTRRGGAAAGDRGLAHAEAAQCVSGS